MSFFYVNHSEKFLLKDETTYTVGSDISCDLVLKSTNISPLHLIITYKNNTVMITPQPNAITFLNDVQISGARTLAPNDIIRMDTEILKYKFEIDEETSENSKIGLSKELIEELIQYGLPGEITTYHYLHLDLTKYKLIATLVKNLPSSRIPQINSNLAPITKAVDVVDTDEVKFTAYYPREFSREKRGSVIVYAHIADAISAITKDVHKYMDDLGGTIPRPRNASQSIQIKPKTPITVSIECEDVEFDPPMLTRRWDDEWVRFHFEFKSPASFQEEQFIFHVSISIFGVEVARIPNCTTELIDLPSEVAAESTEELQVTWIQEETRLYQKIFVSYSRRDAEVVNAYKLAQEAVGNDVFVDTYSIRTGENWKKALETAIENADVFQLFWSLNSAASEPVRDEWHHALQTRCASNDCSGFIRPIYWQNPVPTPPRALQHLNFRYIPLPSTT